MFSVSGRRELVVTSMFNDHNLRVLHFDRLELSAISECVLGNDKLKYVDRIVFDCSLKVFNIQKNSHGIEHEK